MFNSPVSRNNTEQKVYSVCYIYALIIWSNEGGPPKRNRVTPRLRFSRYAPSALRAQGPLSHCLQKTTAQTMRQSGFAGPDPVADAKR